MAWVAFDRAVKTVERLDREGPVERWRAIREEIKQDVLRSGYDADLGSFVQYYGSDRLDASLLMIPLVGFLPPKDPRVVGTVAAIERDLLATASSSATGQTSTTSGWTGSAGRGRLPPVLVLAGRGVAQRDGSTRPSSSSSGFSRYGTTSACSRRSTTPSGSASWGTSRRRSRT